ncbi:MAG: hypothetical protein HQL60_05555, partial [Magnetococcales bacterium]|nr:hypothetical protein [Magnetococcales bacterium]
SAGVGVAADLSPELRDIIGSWNHIDDESTDVCTEDEGLVEGWDLELAKMFALDEEEKALSRDELEDQAAWLRSRSELQTPSL